MPRSSRMQESSQITVIRPIKGWKKLNLVELWEYRELLLAFCVRDIKIRYKQTVLGAAWAILQPLVTMLIFSIIFGRLAGIPSDGFPYPVFVYSGLLPWMLFSNAISSSSGSMVGSAHMVSKIYFPRVVIPFSAVGSGLVDFAVSACILLLLMFVYDVPWTWQLIVTPVLLTGVILVALGVGTALSALTVSYRDFRYVVPFMVQIWMYLTPVVYPLGFIPEKWRWLLYLNPLTGYIEGFRSVFLGKPFDFVGISSAVILTMFVFLGGLKYFRKVEQRFADVI
ncbi:MAG: ABC transporter permease [Arenicellales bacterium]